MSKAPTKLLLRPSWLIEEMNTNPKLEKLATEFLAPKTLGNKSLLLAFIAEQADFGSIMELLERDTFDSVCHGVCVRCGNLQDSEPDAYTNICDECNKATVRSSLALANLI